MIIIFIPNKIMDTIKCNRFKTFREELLSKKFQFINEDESIHKMKVVNEDSSNQNKASEVGVKIMKEGLENQEEEQAIDPQPTANTGMFRDNLRRIDIVLVVEDNPSSSMDGLKMAFLSNIIKTGLEVEVESGLMPAHKKLSFIKIHAPNKVLTEYGDTFGVKRYFVDNRLNSISPKVTKFTKIFNIFMNENEREWIKIVRKNYVTANGYSHFERSLIVYKILLHLPFGDHANYYGVNRLLKKHIIVDAYALHDGPYFLLPNQTARGTNARQILYYSWTGVENIFKSQPLHLIHEYFGPTVAFYFAFYGYLNKALAIASIGGIITFVMSFIDKSEDILRQLICDAKYKMCPYCANWKRCPFRNSTEYCNSIAVNLTLDHPYSIYFSIFMVFWALSFITLWKRKEHFLKWMWEVNSKDLYYKTAYRPEFKINYKSSRISYKTGIKYNESGYYKFLRFIISKGIIVVYFLSIIPIMTITSKMHDKFFDAFLMERKKEKWWDYMLLAMFQTVYTLVVSFLEKIYSYIIYYAASFENHKTPKSYEKSLIEKQFGFSMTLTYPFMGYIAWMVSHYIFLGRCSARSYDLMTLLHKRFSSWTLWPWDGRQCSQYCWPFTCIIELSILLIVTLLVRQVIFRVANYIYGLRTDYSRGSKINSTIPCWEREYDLSNVDENFFTNKYLLLAIQFSLITLFVVSFPLAPLVVLLVNLWDLRHTARKLLLASKRPLHIRQSGIGTWNNMLLFTAYAAIITNATTLAFSTRLILRYYFTSRNKPINTTLDFVLFHLRTDEKHFRKKECYSPEFLEPYGTTYKAESFFWYGLLDKLTRKSEYYMFSIYKVVFIFLFSHIMCLGGFLLKYLFPPNIREIEETKAVENRIKSLYYHYKDKVENKEKIGSYIQKKM